jgi:hypothetical protein
MNGNLQLRFVNLSGDGGVSNVVFFQKNGANATGSIIAWRVARNCGYRNYCCLPYNWETEIDMVDWNGNHCPRQAAAGDGVFHIVRKRYGKKLEAVRTEGHPTQVWVQNRLDTGAPHITLYRSGCVVARHENLIPGQWAKFDVEHWLHVVVMPCVKQGDDIAAHLGSASIAKFFLQGIASADIVMVGGGRGRDAQALRFMMTNVVMH